MGGNEKVPVDSSVELSISRMRACCKPVDGLSMDNLCEDLGRYILWLEVAVTEKADANSTRTKNPKGIIIEVDFMNAEVELYCYCNERVCRSA